MRKNPVHDHIEYVLGRYEVLARYAAGICQPLIESRSRSNNSLFAPSRILTKKHNTKNDIKFHSERAVLSVSLKVSSRAGPKKGCRARNGPRSAALDGTLAQSNNLAGGSSQAGGPAATKITTGDSTAGTGAAMKNGATDSSASSSTPFAKDASTRGANTAGSAEKKGEATLPGGTMKK
jgi:hypothetical protein